MGARIVAFDLGAESGRAVVGELDRGKLSLNIARRFPNVPVKLLDTAHWNVLAMFQEMQAGLAAAAAEGEVASLGCDSWGVDFGLVSAKGELVGNPVIYRDPRTDGMPEAAYEIVPRDEIYRATGIQIMQINTLFQLFSLAKSGSPLLKAAGKLTMMAGLFHFLFTGRVAEEFSLATTSQMYDPFARDWAKELLGRLGLPVGILPEVVPCGTEIGPLRRDIAEETGAKGVRVLAPPSHDTASAVAAVPATGEGWAYLSSGTWSLMGAEIPSPIVSEKALQWNFTNEGGAGGGIRFLKNIMGLWLVQQCRAQWERGGEALDYDALVALAADAEPFQAVVNPDDPAFLHPPDMPAAIREYCVRTGQKPPESRGAIVRCALESLALRYRATLARLDDVLGRKHNVLHVVGGGSRNDLLNQFTADACGVPVVAGPVEATAAGNVLMQAVALGELGGPEDVRRVVRDSFETKTFGPGDAARWDEAFERFRKLEEDG